MERFPNIDQETKTNIVKLTGALLAVSGTGYVIYYFYRTHSHKKLIAKKRQELSERKRNLLTKLESLGPPIDQIDKITSMKLSALIDQLSSGNLSAIDVVRAFQAKSLMMDREYNFVTDLNPAIDEDVAAIAGVKKGALKGVPVSVKECFSVRGCDSTEGMLDRVFEPNERDDMMVRTLRMQGMVPFVTTNMCQTGYSIESSNPIYGQTVNPHCVSRTCGGSSGGEGAILACGASVVGLGSDIGGSIRIPASYCGVFGLKPTSQRFSHRHSKYFYAEQNLIRVSVGPMARSIEDLVAFFKALACGDLYHLDPYCPPLCFNDKIFDKKRPLRIGWYSDLGEGQVRPVPAVARAVEMAKSALTRAGHAVVPFAIPDIDYAIFELYTRCLFSDGGVGFIDHYVKRNPIDPTISLTTTLLKIPNCLKWFVSALAYPINRNYSRFIRSSAGCSSVYELWRLKDRVAEYRERVLALWQAERLDGIVCPVLPICAPPLGTSEAITDVVGYTAIYNLLDYPAGSVPVTRVTQADVDELVRSYPRNTVTQRSIVECQKDSVGMPVGVQCVSMLWREETCLRIMRDITDNIQTD